jgi:hypothetical protein
MIGMFLDLTSMWKKTEVKVDPQYQKQVVPPGYIQLPSTWDLLKSVIFNEPNDTSRARRHTSWHRRRIGILYSKQPKYWVFLVLIAPGHQKDEPEEWKFCYRIIQDVPETNEVNACCTGGLRFYNGAQQNLQDAINYFSVKVKDRGMEVLEQIFLDIFWGWEEYLTYVKSEAMSV